MSVPSTQSRQQVEREAHKKLSEEKAGIIRDIHALKPQLEVLQVTYADMIKKTGYGPGDYKRVEDEHFKKMKDMETSVVNLRIEREKEENKLTEAINGQTIIAKSVTDLEQKQTVLQTSVGRLTQSLTDLEQKMTKAGSDYQITSTEHARALLEATGQIEKLRIEAADTKRDLDIRTSSVVNQEKSMAIRRSDLEIYEARLRTKYPNESFV
jgi:hypothetical protein